MRVLPVVLGVGLLCALVTTVAADETRPRLDRVVITGNQRVEEEAIRGATAFVSRAPASTRKPSTTMSARSTVWASSTTSKPSCPAGRPVGADLSDYGTPLIHEVHLDGNKKIGREDLEGAFKVRPNTILDPEKVRRGIEEAKKLYEKKGYLDAAIDYSTKPVGEHEVILRTR